VSQGRSRFFFSPLTSFLHMAIFQKDYIPSIFINTSPIIRSFIPTVFNFFKY